MANGDEGTFAEDLQHTRQQPLNGMRAERSRRQLSSEGAHHVGHFCKETMRPTAPVVSDAGEVVAPRWPPAYRAKIGDGLGNYFVDPVVCTTQL